MKKSILLIASVLLLGITSKATHIVGGEFSVQWISGNTFHVTLHFYRDCANGQADFDNPATMGIYDKLTNVNQQCLSVSLTSRDTLKLGDACYSPDLCVELGTYDVDVVIPNNPDGYYISYSRCCRNGAVITNIANAQNAGETWYASFPNPSLHNSTPVFGAYPKGYMCANNINIQDFSCTDADNDSLVYSLVTPLNGNTTSLDPVDNCPDPAPYPYITWTGPGNDSVYIGGPMSINPQTGILTATPGFLGVYVYCVEVDEWSRGQNPVKLGEVRRDIQSAVLTCTSAAAYPDTTVCAGNPVQIHASGGTSYSWSPTTGLSNPNIPNPIATVFATTTYTVSVTNGSCVTTATVTVNVNSAITVSITPNGVTTFCQGSSVGLAASGAANYTWSTGATTSSINVSASGTYSVVGTSNGCSGSASIVVNVLPAPVVTITPNGPTTFCQGGTVKLTVSGANSYLWSTGATTTAINVSSSGTYSVVGTTNECTGRASQPVIVNPLPKVVITPSGATTFCQGDSVTLTASGAMRYAWDNGSTNVSITSKVNQTYDAVGTDANGCSAVSNMITVIVNRTPNVVITPNGPTSFCVGGNVQLCASGGTTYSWSPGGSTSNCLTVSSQGHYTVRSINSNECVGTASINVSVNAVPAVTITGGPASFCAGDSAILIASGANSYVWSPRGATTDSITVKTAGTYFVVGTNGGGCSAVSDSITITVNPNPSVTVTPTNGNCTITASACANPSGGSGSYSYLWSNNTSSSCINVASTGTYSVTITDANLCAASNSGFVSIDTTSPSLISSNNGPLTCVTTSVNLSANRCIPSEEVTYSWSGPNGYTSSSQCPSASVAGTYTVIATGPNGCTSISTTPVFSDTIPPSLIVSNNGPLTCVTKSVNLIANGCVQAEEITYSWSGPNGYSSSSQCPTVSVAGNYIVTVTGPNGCSNIDTNPVFADTLPPSLIVSNNGPLTCVTKSVNLIANGCVQAEEITYNWSGPNGYSSSSQCPTVSVAGNYIVTVIGPNGCSNIDTNPVFADTLPPSVIVSNNGPLTCVTRSVNLIANGCVQAEEITYSWSGPNGYSSSSQCPTVSVAGNYIVTVTGPNGCSNIDTNPVFADTLPPALITGNNGPLTCVTSSVNLIANGCVQAEEITYSWSGPNGYSSSSQCPTVSVAGNYIVTVTGPNGCSASSTDSVLLIPSPTVSCAYIENTGTITATPSGGIGPYSYSWNNGATTQVITATDSGTYTVVVSDFLGCTATCSSVISSGCNGFRTETQGGWGAPPHGGNPGTYLYANFAGAFPTGLVVGCGAGFTLTLDSAQNVTGFLPSGSTPRALTASLVDPAGSYSNVFAGQVVTLALNVGFDLYDPNFGMSSTHLRDLFITEGLFKGWTVGQLLAEAENALGGCGSIYSFSDLNDAVDAVNSNYDDGTGDNGFLTCNNCRPSCDISGGDTSICNGQSTQLCAPQGTGYTYLWSDGETTQCITVSSGGTYSVTVTSSAGCSSTCNKTVIVNPNPDITVTSTDGTCHNSDIASLCANPSGGSGNNYSYIWSTLATTSCISVQSGGSYSVNVTDGNGCSAGNLGSVAIIQNPTVSCAYMQNDGTITATPSGGIGPYSYSWSSGQTTQVITATDSGTYTVVVTDSVGCTASCSSVVSSNCNGFRTETQGGWGAPPHGGNPGTYLYANFAGAFPTGLVVGCGAGFTLTLDSAQNVTGFLPSGSTPRALTASLVDPAGTYSNVFAGQVVTLALNVGFDLYDPNFGISSTHLQDLFITEGLFKGWTVGQLLAEAEKALGGCGSIYSFSDLNDAVDAVNSNYDDGTGDNGFLTCNNCRPSCNISGGDTSICNGQSTQLCAPQGTGYTYLWSDGETTQCITVSSGGTYSVTVTSSAGCSSTCNKQVVVNPPSNVTITPDGSTTICEGSGVNLCATSGSSYLWSPGGKTTQCVFAQDPGHYIVQVTNQFGCSDTAGINIIVGLAPSVIVSPTDGNCRTGGIGSACANALGGSGVYSYLWNGGATTSCINVSATGTYTVTVTDANHCTANNSATVNINTTPPNVNAGADKTLGCGSGSVQLNGSSTTAGATYSWVASGGGHIVSGANALTPTVNQPGTYTLTVTNSSNGCTASDAVVVTGGQAPNCNIAITTCQLNHQHCTCTLNHQHCTSPNCTLNHQHCTCSLNHVHCFVSESTCQENHTHCKCTLNHTHCTGPNCTLNHQHCQCTLNHVHCYTESCTSNSTCSGGTRTLVASGGGTYLWSTGATTSSITVSSSGTYSVTVSNGTGCTSMCSQAIVISTPPSCTITGNGSICSGGSTSLCAPPGSGLSYSWSPGGATGQCIAVNAAGTYYVTVTNSSGCSATCNKSVTVNPVPSCSISMTTCQLNHQHCTCTLNHQHCTSPNCTLNHQHCTCSVNHVHCFISESTCQENHTHCKCTLNHTHCTGPNCTLNHQHCQCTLNHVHCYTESCTSNSTCSGGSITLVASGGTSYVWSNGATTASVTVSASGTYSVTVTNSSGCSSTCSQKVNISTPPSCTISGNGSICSGGSTSLCAPAGSGLSYSWSNGASSQCINVTCANTYYVTVTNSSGCSATCDKSVTVNAAPACSISITSCRLNHQHCTCTLNHQHCNGPNCTLNHQHCQCSLNHTHCFISQSTCQSNHSHCKCTLNHTHCSGVNCTLNHQHCQCMLNHQHCYTGSESENDFCNGGSVTLVASGGGTYVWSTGATTQSITVSESGDYSVTVTNSSGCSSTCSQSVTVNQAPSCNISGNLILKNGQCTTLCAPAGYSKYQWSNGSNSQCITVNCQGNYSVTVTNSNGCSSTCSVCVTKQSGCGRLMDAAGADDYTLNSYGNIDASAYPNPFSNLATIAFRKTDANTHVHVEIYTLDGNKVATLFDGEVEAGVVYQAQFDASSLADGIYLYKIISDNNVVNGKLIQLRH